MNKRRNYAQVLCMNAQSNRIESWDDVRVAYHVARLGTLSAAAAFLGVHHATVIRHIDALEGRLGSKLFQRNPRGYTPTEAGLELLRVAATTDDQLAQLSARLIGRSDTVSGDLTVTTLSGLSPQITPLLVEFGALYESVRLVFIADERPLKMEYGEAHVALRAGGRPQEPDNIAQEVASFPVALFAHKSYVAKYGALKGGADAANHRFVGNLGPIRRAPFQRWMTKHVPDEAIVYRVSEMRSYEDAVHQGAGLGFISLWSGGSNPDLVQMGPSLAEWDTKLWIVTHVDLHRTAKVQALATFLRDKLKEKIRQLDAARLQS